jgi:stage V sporulation protein B
MCKFIIAYKTVLFFAISAYNEAKKSARKEGQAVKHSRQFMVQAIMMGAFSILMRAIGVSFQVYVVSRVGAQVSGLSALMGGVFGFAVTLALSGIQLGCTRLVAEDIGSGQGRRVRQTMVCALLYACFFGVLAATLLFWLAEPIARLGLRHAETVVPLRIMALSLPPMALSACLSGYFIAVRRVYKSTILQLGEQLLRICLTVFLFRGVQFTTPAHALSLLARADTLSCMSAALCLLALFLLDRRAHAAELPDTGGSSSLRHVAAHLLAVTLPVAVSAYARSGLISLEHLLLPAGLARYGQAEGAALAAYGALQSMALPVVLFPAALPAAFANLLIPEVTERHVRGEMSQIRGIIQRVLSLALLFAIGVAGIMVGFADELGQLLYQNEQASHFIRCLAPLIPVMYLDSAVDAMLKGLGQQVNAMGINIIDASLSVLLVWILVPRMGIYGYLVTIYITELVNATLSILRLIRVSRVRVFPVRWVLKPVLGASGAIVLFHLSRTLLPAFSFVYAQKIAAVVLAIAICALLYLLLCFTLGAIRPYELRWILHLFSGEAKNGKKAASIAVAHLDE